MNSTFINIAFKLKAFLLRKGLLVHWQYLLLASLVSFFGGVSWAYIGIKWGVELGFLAALSGLLQGFLAFLYMHKKGDPRLIAYSIFFTLFTLFLGKYLLYVHYFDWELSSVVDKEQVNFSLIVFYLKAMDYERVGLFITYFREHVNLYDILWILLSISTSLEYILFYKSDSTNGRNGLNSKGKYRRINRRFTGQRH